MPRLLFDVRSRANQGGVSRVTERVLLYVQRTQPHAEIKTITTGWEPHSADIHVRLPNKLWSFLTLFRLTSLDRAATAATKQSFDELILPNVGFVGKPKIPYTIVVHDLSFLIEPHWFPWKMRFWHRAVRATKIIKQATHIWCVSHTTARDVERLLNIPHERITVLPHAVIAGSNLRNLDAPATGNAAPVGRYVLAFTGSRRKNAATAIATVARLKEDPRFADLRLFLVGAETARQHLHHPWLAVIPHLTEPQLHDFYKRAAALLYPSWYEGFGLPLHEAAAYNVPLLASAHGALPETAPHGTILIPPAKPHLWVSALRESLSVTSQQSQKT